MPAGYFDQISLKSDEACRRSSISHENDLFDLCDPYITFEVKLLIFFVATHLLAILTKFGRNRIKHVEEEANCEKEERRKKKLESVPFSRARVKLGGRVSNYQVAQPLTYISEPLTVAQMRRLLQILFIYAQPKANIITLQMCEVRLLTWSNSQLLALLDLMWSPIQQLTMLNLMCYKSGYQNNDLTPMTSSDPWLTCEPQHE